MITDSVFSVQRTVHSVFLARGYGAVLQAAERLLDSFRPQLSAVVLGVLVRLLSVHVRRFVGPVVALSYIINVTNPLSSVVFI